MIQLPVCHPANGVFSFYKKGIAEKIYSVTDLSKQFEYCLRRFGGQKSVLKMLSFQKIIIEWALNTNADNAI